MDAYTFPGWEKQVLECPEGTPDGDFLKAQGFDPTPAFDLGHAPGGHGLQADVHPNLKPAPGGHSYYVGVKVGSGYEAVLCPDFPALLQFLNLLSPVAAVALQSWDQEEEEIHLLLHETAPESTCRFCARERAGLTPGHA